MLAEGEGFEPPIALRLRLISSQVPSTTQPPFQPFRNKDLEKSQSIQIDDLLVPSRTAGVPAVLPKHSPRWHRLIRLAQSTFCAYRPFCIDGEGLRMGSSSRQAHLSRTACCPRNWKRVGGQSWEPGEAIGRRDSGRGVTWSRRSGPDKRPCFARLACPVILFRICEIALVPECHSPGRRGVVHDRPERSSRVALTRLNLSCALTPIFAPSP